MPASLSVCLHVCLWVCLSACITFNNTATYVVQDLGGTKCISHDQLAVELAQRGRVLVWLPFCRLIY